MKLRGSLSKIKPPISKHLIFLIFISFNDKNSVKTLRKYDKKLLFYYLQPKITVQKMKNENRVVSNIIFRKFLVCTAKYSNFF